MSKTFTVLRSECNIDINVHLSIYNSLPCAFQALAKGAGHLAGIKHMAKFQQILILIVLVKCVCHDNSILIVDTTVFLTQTKCTYLLAGSLAQISTECQAFV